MKIVPYRRFLIKTSKSKNEIMQIILSNAEHPLLFRLYGSKPFWGKINDKGFKLTPNINYRNSFVPVIKGYVIEYDKGSIVNVKMRPYIFVIIFMSIFLAALAYTLITAIFSGQEFRFTMLIPFIIFLFVYELMYFLFQLEATNSKKLLTKLLGD